MKDRERYNNGEQKDGTFKRKNEWNEEQRDTRQMMTLKRFKNGQEKKWNVDETEEENKRRDKKTIKVLDSNALLLRSLLGSAT